MIKAVVLVAYILLIVGVLIVTARKSLSVNDFLLAGRSVGAWMSALSYGASYFSAVIIVGYAGSMGWDYGVAAVWAGVGNALIGSFLAWRLLARPTRIMGERLRVSTLPGFLEKRYQAKGLKVIGALLIFVFLLPYTASVYKGLATMFEMALGIDYTLCVIGVALLASLYLFAGGYKATALTDVFQGLIMVVGVSCIIGYLIRGAGGLTGGLARLGELGGFNSLLPRDNPVGLWSNVIVTSVGVLGMPQMIHKFFAVKDAKTANQAMVISTLFALVIAGGVYLAGGFSRAILDQIPMGEDTAAQMVAAGTLAKDQIIPTLLTDQSVVRIPEALQGLFIVLLLSASISSLTALVLASASVLSIDLLGIFLPKRQPKTVTNTMRILCVVFVALSLVIHFLMQNTPIMQMMSLSWGTIAGAFLAPFLYGLLWRGTTKAGAYAGVVGGALIALIPPLCFGLSLAPLSGAAAMLGGLVIVPAVSLLTPRTALSAAHLENVFGK